MNYEELKRELATAPATWVPGLLTAIVTAGVRRNVFQPGGLQRFITRAEEQAEADLAAGRTASP